MNPALILPPNATNMSVCFHSWFSRCRTIVGANWLFCTLRRVDADWLPSSRQVWSLSSHIGTFLVTFEKEISIKLKIIGLDLKTILNETLKVPASCYFPPSAFADMTS